MKELGRVTVVHPVRVPPISVPIVKDDTVHPVPAWRKADTVSTCAADTITYHRHIVKKEYSLPDGILDLPDLKTRPLQPRPTDQDDLDG